MDGARSRRGRARDVGVDVAMLALSVAVGLSGDTCVVHGLIGFPLPLRVADVVVGVLGCVALFWRRRYPLVFAGFILLAAIFATTVSGLTFVAVFTVAVHRRWPTALVVSALYALSVWPSLALYGDFETDLTGVAVLAVLLTFAFTGWGMFVRARRELVTALRERAERAERDQQPHVDEARTAERERIAREMHDVLAHRLSLLSLHAGALEFRPDASADEIARAAGVIRANAHAGLDELREVIHVLRGELDAEIGPPQPRLTELPDLVEQSRRAGSAIELELGALDLDTVPTSSGRAVYRIVQEGLTNARKHAPGGRARVAVLGDPEAGLRVSVHTPSRVGRRPATLPGSGTGLIGLAERAAIAGGRLEHGPTDDGEFRIEAWLPWHAEAIT